MDPMGLLLKREHVEKWLAEHLPGEPLVSHMLASQYSPLNTAGVVADVMSTSSNMDHGDRGRVSFIESLDLDPDKKVGFLEENTVYALTDRHLCIGTRGGFRNRPKEVLHTGPLEGLVVHWYDGPVETGTQLRHWVAVFADGTWRGDRTGVKTLGGVPKANNAQHFFESLGPRAVETT